MFDLMKKDYVLVKKVWWLVLALMLAMPLFLSYVSSQEGRSLPSGLLLSMLASLLVLVSISALYQEEEKYPKAAAMITTLGYSRKEQIRERYALALSVFIGFAVLYGIAAQFLPGLEPLTILGFAISYCVISGVIALYLYLVTKLGVLAARYVQMLVILAISLGPTLLSMLHISFSLDFLASLSQPVLCSLLIAMGLFFYGLSYVLTVQIYLKKEL